MMLAGWSSAVFLWGTQKCESNADPKVWEEWVLGAMVVAVLHAAVVSCSKVRACAWSPGLAVNSCSNLN